MVLVLICSTIKDCHGHRTTGYHDGWGVECILWYVFLADMKIPVSCSTES